MCRMSNLRTATRQYVRARGGWAGCAHGYVGPVLSVALDTVAHPPRTARGQVGGVVGAHDEGIVGRVRQVVRERSRLVDVVPGK